MLFIPACSQCNNVHEQIALKSEACSIIFFHSSEVNEVDGAFFPINFRSIQRASYSVWGQFFSITFMRQQRAGCRAKQVGYVNWQPLCFFFFLSERCSQPVASCRPYYLSLDNLPGLFFRSVIGFAPDYPFFSNSCLFLCVYAALTHWSPTPD